MCLQNDDKTVPVHNNLFSNFFREVHNAADLLENYASEDIIKCIDLTKMTLEDPMVYSDITNYGQADLCFIARLREDLP